MTRDIWRVLLIDRLVYLSLQPFVNTLTLLAFFSHIRVIWTFRIFFKNLDLVKNFHALVVTSVLTQVPENCNICEL